MNTWQVMKADLYSELIWTVVGIGLAVLIAYVKHTIEVRRQKAIASAGAFSRVGCPHCPLCHMPNDHAPWKTRASCYPGDYCARCKGGLHRGAAVGNPLHQNGAETKEVPQ